MACLSPQGPLAAWRQGDVAVSPGLYISWGAGLRSPDPAADATDEVQDPPLRWREADRVVVLTQSCDLQRLQDGGALVQVADCVELDASKSGLARTWRMPRYAPLPHLGAAWFADLGMASSIAVDALAASERIPIVEDASGMRFGRAIARYYGRFAFPDDVVLAMRPMASEILRLVKKGASGDMVLLADVEEIRAVAHPAWTADAISVVLTFVLADGVAPSEAHDALVARLVALCRTGDSVHSVDGIALSASEFSLSALHASERLDLDNLSPEADPEV